MKTFLRRLPALVVLAAAMAGAADAQVAVGGNVSDGSGGPFLAGTVYHASALTVPAGQTLTIQAGAIVKFQSGTTLHVHGTLLCGGAGAVTHLASISDDGVGGDTNMNGPSAGSAGDWFGVRFHPGSDASVLENVQVRHAGRFTSPGIVLDQAGVTLNGVSVMNPQGAGLDAGGNSFPTVSNCAFDGGTHAVIGVTFAAVGGFSNNTASDNSLGDHILLLGGSLSSSVTLAPSGLINDAHVMSSSLTIGAGTTLTVQAGVGLKWPLNATCTVDGTLNVAGTAGNPVHFVSIADDTVGGDTQSNGPTFGTAGDWFGIRLNDGSDASVLSHLVVRHGGRFTSESVRLDQSSATLAGCVVEQGQGAALRLNLAHPTVSGCAFDTHQLAIVGVPIDAIPGFSGNTASGNADGNAMHRDGSGTNGNVTIATDNLLNDVLVSPGSLTVSGGHVLTIGEGVVLKFATNATFHVDGTLDVDGTSGNPVVATADVDDVFGGDSNGNGGATIPARGHWFGLRFGPGSSGSIVEGMIVRWGGRFTSAAIDLTAADVTLTDCVVEESDGACLDLSNTSHPAVTGCTFRNSDDGSVVGVPMDAVPGFVANVATGNGLDAMTLGNPSVSGTVVVQTSNVIGGALFASNSFTVSMGATLIFGPGVVTKFAVGTTLHVAGTLVTNGTPSNRTVFTSIRDDAVAGDTNKDGLASTPAAGDWFGISCVGSNSVLSGLRIRYGGRFTSPMLSFAGGAPVLINPLFESSQGAGMGLSQSASPVMFGASFTGNGTLISGLTWGVLANVRRTTATGNGLDVFVMPSGTVGGVVSIIEDNLVNGVLHCGSVSVSAGEALTLQRGVDLKFASAATLNVDSGGTLVTSGTAYRPVILTSVEDDETGGDTNADAFVTVPNPGEWFGVRGHDSALGVVMEHTLVRFAGRFSSPGIDVGASQNVLRAVRSEHAQGPGFVIESAANDVVNCVAFSNGGTGFRCTAGNFNLVHCTSVGNGGFGFDKDGTHAGGLVSSIAWSNGNNALDGYTAPFVVTSDAGAAVAGVNGNIHADPMFVDQAGGDLEILATSPCLDAADTAAASQLILDFKEGSRRTDSEITGMALADMGAYERATYRLAVGGIERLGTTMTFTVTGPDTAPALIGLGFLDGFGFCDPCGYLTIGLEQNIAILAVTNVGTPLQVQMPADFNLEGIEFGIQGLGAPFVDPVLGNMTERYRARLFN